MAATTGQTDLKAVKEFLGLDLPDMKAEWARGGLSSKDREQIAGGSGASSPTYADRGPGAGPGFAVEEAGVQVLGVLRDLRPVAREMLCRSAVDVSGASSPARRFFVVRARGGIESPCARSWLSRSGLSPAWPDSNRRRADR